ncbi:restriction endonuclease subunit S [Vibrio sp. MM46]|uniref:restriction endonuclease subunit S n=1 Tax=Vibrio TaxID=662 RepID=UPI00215C40D7|nr:MULTISPECIES: restriction endonuclease subunit S [Vibrio]MCR9780321.1 restriction endonuclease subunit S [Vibrio parahaemolyticus]MDA0125927.1 restriction endonuclease subunit S [Vibrio sp. MM46]
MSMTKNVPDIRFDGFSGEWDVVPFSESFSFLSSNTLSRAELNYEGGKARNIHYGDILVKLGDVIDAQGTDIPYISSDELVSKMSATKLQDGDVLFADAAEDESVGKCIEVTNVGEETVFSGLHTIATRPNQFFATNYLGYYLNSGSFHHQLLPLMQGTKVLSISKKSISKVDVKYPSDSLEQGDIGNYFRKLDSLINQHQQKHDKLSNLKKAMLEKMFPKVGESVPEIRFDGFSGEWTVKNFSEEIEMFSGLTYSPNDVQKAGVLVIRSSNVKNGQLVQADNVYVDPEVVNCSNVIKGDIVVVVRNGSRSLIGKHALVTSDMENTVIGAFMTGIRSAQPEFINALLDTNMFKAEVEKNLGATINQITNSAFKSMSFRFPTNDEKRQIGSYFQKLDSLINQHNQQITKLKNIKQACLDKMFV